VRCPQCGETISFDETRYDEGQKLIFTCLSCGKKFATKLGTYRFGSIHVIENVFHYKQVIPLKMGDNIIGRHMRGNDINCPIHTDDPSIDLTHCVINVSADKHGKLKYILRDGPSNTGTFVDNTILGDRERRVLDDGSLFTIGATSILLKTNKR